MTEKFYSIFFKKLQGPAGRAPGRPSQRAKSFPKNRHRTGRAHTPQCMGPWEDPCKGSSYGKSPLDAGFSHKRARTTVPSYPFRWDYVGRHAADRFSPVSPLKLSGGQFETIQLADAALMQMLYHAFCAACSFTPSVTVDTATPPSGGRLLGKYRCRNFADVTLRLTVQQTQVILPIPTWLCVQR